ncbi:MAG: Clp protease N-terminal domain-containing protein [Planctomycetota bacterium]
MLDDATDRGKTAMRLARRHADACRQPAVDTAHLFLGLVEEGTGVAATALQQVGVTLERAKARVPQGDEPERGSARQQPLTPELRACLELAQGLAERLRHPTVSTEHLLLGLLQDPSGAVPELLQGLETTARAVQAEVYAVLGEAPPVGTQVLEPERVKAPAAAPANDAERWRTLDALVQEIDGHRPFTSEVAERVRGRIEPRFLFASAAIGRRQALSLNEVQAFLEREVVSGGHPLQRYLDLQRHRRMYERVEQFARRGAPFELEFVRALHAGLRDEDAAPSPWRQKPSPLTRRKGHEFSFCPPEQIEALMIRVGAEFEELRRREHPLRAAAWLYHHLFRASPFERDNGRVLRLLVSGVLQNAGYPALVIEPERLGELLDALVAAEVAAAAPPSELSDPEAVTELADLLASCLLTTGQRVLAVARGEDLQAHELPAAVARGQEESLARLLESGEVSWRVTAGRQVRLLYDRLHALAQAVPCVGPLYEISLDSADVVPSHRVAGSGLARALPVGDAGALGLIQLSIQPSQETPGLRFPPPRRMRLAIAGSQLGLHLVGQWDEDRPQRADGPAEAAAWADDQLNLALTRSVDAQRKSYELAILDANLGREEQRKIRQTLRLRRQQPLPATRPHEPPQEPVSATSPLLDPVRAAPPPSERATRRIPSSDGLEGLSAAEPPLDF